MNVNHFSEVHGHYDSFEILKAGQQVPPSCAELGIHKPMSNRLPIVCTRQIDRINFGDSYEDF
jgi:hypothetical protein